MLGYVLITGSKIDFGFNARNELIPLEIIKFFCFLPEVKDTRYTLIKNQRHLRKTFAEQTNQDNRLTKNNEK